MLLQPSGLEKAHKDLRVTAILLDNDIADYENAGFHAQQATEKFIKAFLVCYQIEFPKTHNMTLLRQLIAQANQSWPSAWHLSTH